MQECDCEYVACHAKPPWVCACERCAREDVDEKFYSCDEHRVSVSATHLRIRGEGAAWSRYPTRTWSRYPTRTWSHYPTRTWSHRFAPSLPSQSYVGETTVGLVAGMRNCLRGLLSQPPYNAPIGPCERALDAVDALARRSDTHSSHTAATWVPWSDMDAAWKELIAKSQRLVADQPQPIDCVRAAVSALAALDYLWTSGVRAINAHRSGQA